MSGRDPFRSAVGVIEVTRPHRARDGVTERIRAMPREELEQWIVQLLAHLEEVQAWLGAPRSK
jgi:hypothetical protein